MCWHSVVIFGIGSFILIAWFTSQRHVFKGPSINFDMLNEARNETLKGGAAIPIIHGLDIEGVGKTPEGSVSGKAIKRE
jgi:hypothetical protein